METNIKWTTHLNKLAKNSLIAMAVLSSLSLAGCAAVSTAINHHDLSTNTRMSHTIFLNPVSRTKQTVYVRVGNTSGQSNMNFSNNLKHDLKSRGYRVVSTLSRAHYMIQANIIKAGKTNLNNVQSILSGGYGGAIGGGLIGLGAGALIGDSGDATVAGGLIGAAVGFAADALVKDEMYGLVSDVQISVRAAKGQHYQSETTSNMQEGSSSQQVIHASGSTQWQRFRTRVISTAQQVNLHFAKARPILLAKTAQSIAGLFVTN